MGQTCAIRDFFRTAGALKSSRSCLARQSSTPSPIPPTLEWINRAFGWDLEIHSHWIPFFLLTLTIVVGWLRHLWVMATDKGRRTIAAAIAGGAIGAFFGALASGLLPLDAPWWGKALPPEHQWRL